MRFFKKIKIINGYKMYYIYSLCLTLIIFLVINMYEKKTFIKSKDIIVLIVIYIVSTFILYYLYNSNKNEQTVKVNYIPEPIETGFNLS